MGRLFWKIFFAFWLALLVAGVGVGSAVWLHKQTAERQWTSIDVYERAAPFVSAAAAALSHGGLGALRGLMAEWQGEPAPPVFVVDASGREILGRELSTELLEQARSIAEQGEFRREVRQVLTADGQRYLLFVPAPGDRHWGRGPAFARRGHPPGHGRPPPVLFIASGIIASLIFSAWLAWYLAKPIHSLRGAFHAFSKGRLDTRIGGQMGKRRDELADLGAHFDHMAAQIRSLVDAQNCLLHDVSHELRSPLARLQAAIGLAQQQPEKLALSLERIDREARRLDDLVDELLTLSRLEAGVPGEPEQELDIAEILGEIVEDARFEAQAEQVRIQFDDPGEILIPGRAELIRRALENVVRNAVKHTLAGSTIQVLADRPVREGQVRIGVLDQGPGVPDSQLKAIFEPFFRCGEAQEKQGTGLGLAIARRAVLAHGGQIAAFNRAEGGLRIEIELPVTKAPSPGA